MISKTMSVNQKYLIQQTKMESRALEHVTRALEAMLSWPIDDQGYLRKLSSVRFCAEAYQRHMERLFALEEIDGCMEEISRINPVLAHEVDGLRREHEKFRDAVRKSIVRIELASSTRLDEFDETCRELQGTVDEVLEHLRQESALLVESLNRDTGGEG